jgi:DNA repair protein RecO
MEFNVQGIILRAQDFKDADCLYSILTLENGLIRATAKSVKKIESKLGGFLLPSNQVILMLAGGKSGISKIAQVKVELTHSRIVEDHEIFLLFSQLVEVLLTALQENLEEREVYEITLSFLKDLNDKTLSIEKKKTLQLSCFSQILEILGFKPSEFKLKSALLSNFVKLLFQNSYLKNRDLMLKLKMKESDFLVLKNWFINYIQKVLETKLNSF